MAHLRGGYDQRVCHAIFPHTKGDEDSGFAERRLLITTSGSATQADSKTPKYCAKCAPQPRRLSCIGCDSSPHTLRLESSQVPAISGPWTQHGIKSRQLGRAMSLNNNVLGVSSIGAVLVVSGQRSRHHILDFDSASHGRPIDNDYVLNAIEPPHQVNAARTASSATFASLRCRQGRRLTDSLFAFGRFGKYQCQSTTAFLPLVLGTYCCTLYVTHEIVWLGSEETLSRTS